MTRRLASRFPALRRVFEGYLHEDFAAEHGTAAAALRAFLEDADADERQRVVRETRRFLALTAALDLDEVRRLMDRLGSRWTPPSREALVALLAAMEDSRTGG